MVMGREGRGEGAGEDSLEREMEGRLGVRVWCCCKRCFLGLIQRELLQKEWEKKLQ